MLQIIDVTTDNIRELIYQQELEEKEISEPDLPTIDMNEWTKTMEEMSEYPCLFIFIEELMEHL